MAHVIPKEILKFRLDKQFGRLRTLLTCEETTPLECDFDSIINDIVGNDEVDTDNKFQLYQRILSWFIMGRLAKMEYDLMLEELLTSPELTDLHNRVIELLRAIYCDTPGGAGGVCSVASFDCKTDIFEKYFLSLDESALVPPEELEVISPGTAQDNDNNNNDDADDSISLVTKKTQAFDTSYANLMLTPAEEALLAESLRNPIHDICHPEDDNNFLSTGEPLEMLGHRLCTEISALPDQTLMRKRFNRHIPSDTCIADPIIALACKSLEDYMKNIMENLLTLRFGEQTLLRPPISYIFPNVSEDPNQTEQQTRNNTVYQRSVTEEDLNLLFRLKPWLLADMESELCLLNSDED